jgi:translation initiation factor 2B subunit (eIF-2B alpha/beta/delta family)
MATTSIKSTYALDVETVRTLERMARSWKVSKSEALRRAIRAAGQDLQPEEPAIAALDALQRRLRLTPAKAEGWMRAARRERRAASTKSERRGR